MGPHREGGPLPLQHCMSTSDGLVRQWGREMRAVLQLTSLGSRIFHPLTGACIIIVCYSLHELLGKLSLLGPEIGGRSILV